MAEAQSVYGVAVDNFNPVIYGEKYIIYVFKIKSKLKNDLKIYFLSHFFIIKTNKNE